MELDELKKQVSLLTQENEELKAKLKKYTTNSSYKKYYQEHKDIVQESQRKYRKKQLEENPDKVKEAKRLANKKYYENKKQKKLAAIKTEP